MDNRGYQHYKQDSLSTMTQGELLLKVFDELVKRLTIADLELKKGNFDGLEKSVDKCVEIIKYLSDTLDRQYPISENLYKLYDYFCYELARVKAGHNDAPLATVKSMVEDLRSSFREADKNAVSQ